MLRSTLILAAAAAVCSAPLLAVPHDVPGLDPELHPPILLQADGKNIDTGPPGHAAPFYGDFDDSGKPSLLVGQFAGGQLRIYKNTGTLANPVFDKGTIFHAGANTGVVPAG
ncbi:MAG: hypothetical protein FWD53_04715 [Phycisphaerales bacterium]|nr:hypothetical protein [Phycisphaerales bacterium]